MAKQNKKINYNLFKMWGSWAIAVLLFLYSFFGTSCTGPCPITNTLIIAFIFGILGFLIGGGIHSLCRHIKNGGKK